MSENPFNEKNRLKRFVLFKFFQNKKFRLFVVEKFYNDKSRDP